MKLKFKEFDQYQLAKYNREQKADAKLTKKCLDKNEERENSLSSCEEDNKAVFDRPVTLKNLIRQLHISEPKENVLCLLGKRYPSSAQEFLQYGLSGEWQPELVGTKMKLPVPYTRETELSKTPIEEHKEAWERLIDSRKLPYMALLRNLRNLLLVGIGSDQKSKVIKHLTNKVAVASSKQMPFRYFAAFSALSSVTTGRKNLTEKPVTAGRKTEKIGRKQLIKHDRILMVNMEELQEYTQAVETAFEVAVRNNLPVVRGSTLIIVDLKTIPSESVNSFGLLSNSPVALKLLLGFMCMTACEHFEAYVAVQGKLFNTRNFRKLLPREGGILKTVKEAEQILTGDNITTKYNKLEPLFETAKPEDTGVELTDLLWRRKQFSTFLVIGHLDEEYMRFATTYREYVGPLKCVLNRHETTKLDGEEDWILLPGYSDQILEFIAKVGNQALVKHVDNADRRFNLVDGLPIQRSPSVYTSPLHRFSIELPEFQQTSVRVFVSSTFRDMSGERDLISGLVFPALRKQLSKLDFPVHLNEIDLRWGVPESATRTPDALRACLEHVATSDYLILLLGERYGWVPPEELVHALPEKLRKRVLRVYKHDMSITELEASLFLDLNYQNERRLICCLRDPKCLEALPAIQRSNFVESSAVKTSRLNAFKAKLKSKGLVHLNNYKAAYAGVVSHYPMMGDLADLGEAIFSSLYSEIVETMGSCKSHQSEDDFTSPTSASVSAAYLESIAASACPRHLREVVKSLFTDLPLRGGQVRRARLMAAEAAATKTPDSWNLPVGQKRKRMENIGHDGGILCLIGSPGSGKTTLMSALATVMARPGWKPAAKEAHASGMTFGKSRDEDKPTGKEWVCRVFVHLVLGAYTSTTKQSGFIVAIPQMTHLKTLLVQWITRIINELLIGCSPNLEKELSKLEVELHAPTEDVSGDLSPQIQAFNKLLNIIGRYVHDEFVFIVDSVDHLQPKTLEWIPDIIPQNVRFIFSLEGDSMTAEHLSLRSDTLFLRMSELSGPEKAAAIRCYFAQYGKVLSETGLTSQLSKLCKKRDAGLPLYLKMACDELRLFSTFETLDADLKKLPDLLPDLVAHIVARASQVCGEHLVKTTLACIVCARRPLHSSQLQGMLSTWLSAQKDEQLASIFATLQNTPLGTQKVEGSQSWKSLLLPSSVQLISPKVKISALALHVLIAQLSPLLAGFDLIDERSTEISSGELMEDEEESLEVTSSLLHAQEGRLRFSSSQVASVVRKLCFESDNCFGRFSSARRLGYMTPSSSRLATRRFKTESGGLRSASPPPPELSSTPNLLQTYMLLLIEFAKDTSDAVYYAFHAGQLHFVRSMLASVEYLQRKAVKKDTSALLEEYLGFSTVSPEILKAWKDEVLRDGHDTFQACRTYVLRSSSLLARFPQLTAQLIIENSSDLGMICAKSIDAMRVPYRVIRFSKSSTNMMPAPAIIFRPNCATGSASPTSLTATSDGTLLACGSENGSISLLDSCNGKELHTFYGHTSAVLDMVFLESEDNANTSLLFSASADASACLWKVARASGVSGLRLARLTGAHTRAITRCAWSRHQRVLVTSGLDGVVNVYHIGITLQAGDPTSAATASVFDLSSFNKPTLSFKTDDQPINALTLAQKHIFVGCWNGSIWAFDRDSPKFVRAQIYSSAVQAGADCEGKRDEHFYSNEAPFIGRYSAIVSLAYSGQKYDLLASLDFNGEVLLINASSMVCTIRLASARHLPPTLTGCLTFFWDAESPNSCLLAYVGSERASHGSIFVCDVSKSAQKAAILTTTDVIEDTLAVCSGSVLPVGLSAFVGYASGNCYVLNSEVKRPVHFGSPEAGAVQVMDCSFFTGDSQLSAAALVVYGTPGGAVVFTPFRASLPHASDNIPKPKLLEKAFLMSPKHHSKAKANDIFWSHAVGGQASGGGKAGGTLSVAAGSGVAASGGGDATCWFYFYDDAALLEGDWMFTKSVCTTEHNAGVSAVAIIDELAVSGGKDGLLVFYKISADQKEVTPMHREPLAHMDWITTIAAVEQDLSTESETVITVASGGNDHRIVIWSFSKALVVNRLTVLTAHMTGLTHLAFKGDILASASADGCLILWQTSTSSVSRLRQIFVDGVSQRSGKICALRFKEAAAEYNDNDQPQFVRSASLSESFSDIGLGMFDDESNGEEKEDSEDGTVKPTNGEEDEPRKETGPMEVDGGTVNQQRSSQSPTVVDGRNGAVLHAREKLELSVGIIGADGCPNNMTVKVLSPFSARAANCLLGHPSATVTGVQLASIFRNADGHCLASAAGSTFGGSGDVRLWKLGSKDSPSCNSEQLITHSRAVTAVLRLVDKERYIFSSSLDGSLIFWSEEEIGGESVWTPNLKMLLYDVDTSDLPPSPISDMRLQMYHSSGNDSVKAVLFALCGNRLFNLTMNLKTLKSIPFSTTLGLCELKERFALKTIDLPVSGFCLTVTEASATEDYAPTVLIGTGFGFLLSVKMLSTPTVQKHDIGVSSRSKDSGLITSLLPLRERVVALCGGSLATFDHQGSFLSDITLSESIEASTLTHLCVPVTGTSYVLVARKLVDGEKERSFISLLGIDGTHHSSYMMPESTQVTALRASERKFGKINETEVLTVVGSSDGLIRFILFDLCTPSNQARLVGFLPSDRKVTSIDCVSSSSFCAGFENGDIGVYYFSPDYSF
ncbi:hypothetical protein AAHC03_05310 [Spirometra sp. Aus1]